VAASNTLLDCRYDNDILEVVPQLRHAIKIRSKGAILALAVTCLHSVLKGVHSCFGIKACTLTST
jgi:hypothetical protein